MSSITLYTAKVSPYAQRVEIALAEAKVNYKAYQIDLQNKPEWYASKVNPENKVPAITYGGPDVPPENPSPESEKLAESLVLVEFIADLFPEANLLPKDPVLRAKARFFIEVSISKFNPAYHNFVFHGRGYEEMLAAIDAIQDILPESGGHAVGEQYTIADVAITPFLARLKVALKYDLGKFPAGQGAQMLNVLTQPKYAKFYSYARDALQRPSFKGTFEEEYIKGVYEVNFARA